MAQRDLYIDRLRIVMTALVLLHHTAITYGAIGGWFYSEIKPSASPSSLLLTLFCATNQAYFMGFFFLLAGYFTPGSLERKGYARFIGDRFLRLGLPLLAFGLILGPLTDGMVSFCARQGLLANHRLALEPQGIQQRPALVCSGAAHLQPCLLRLAGASRRASGQLASEPPTPSRPISAGSGARLAVGCFALAIRQFVPIGINVFGLQLGYFASYIFLFAIGIAAWRYDWLRQLSWKQCPPVGSHPRDRMAAAARPAFCWPSHSARSSNFAGGLSWPAILYAFWEPFVAWGFIALWLLVFRGRLNQPSGFWAWLNRRAYAVYIVHPPVLVGVSLLLHGWAAPALLKFGVVGSLACIACWLVADPFVRLPGVRRVV